ncbi:hypothetical protein [Solimonas sp. K1W22B-7]|uniref:hypothetical protein n=1 Tax=Solimonas sp. K1W22B-7 TaxID=2303331 RepID=UPI0013C3FFB0|nr:hypothetical protein [Solimonas sp. K1W22B-7]
MKELFPEFKPEKIDASLEWHAKQEPLYVYRYTNEIWLFLSFVPVSNNELIWAALGWSSNGKIPESPSYYQAVTSVPPEGWIHVLDPKVTGVVPNDQIVGFEIARPSVEARQKAIDYQYSKEPWIKAIHDEYVKKISKGRVEPFDIYLLRHREESLETINSWSLISGVRGLEESEIEKISTDSAGQCVEAFKVSGRPFLLSIAKVLEKI